MTANLSHQKRKAIQYLQASVKLNPAIGRAVRPIWSMKFWAVTAWGLTFHIATNTALAQDTSPQTSGELHATAEQLSSRGDDRADYIEPCQIESYSNQSQENREDYKYLGNVVSLKFHRPGCPYGQIMARPKRIFFQYRYQAIEQGFKPCRFCLPPVWKTVRARLINPDISR